MSHPASARKVHVRCIHENKPRGLCPFREWCIMRSFPTGNYRGALRPQHEEAAERRRYTLCAVRSMSVLTKLQVHLPVFSQKLLVRLIKNRWESRLTKLQTTFAHSTHTISASSRHHDDGGAVQKTRISRKSFSFPMIPRTRRHSVSVF